MKAAVGGATVMLVWLILVMAGHVSGACRVREVKTTFEGDGVASGSYYNVVKFRNISDGGCKLEGVRRTVAVHKNLGSQHGWGAGL